MAESQPAPVSRLRNDQSSLLSVLAGSEPVAQVGVNGWPSVAVKIIPSSHPPNAHSAGPDSDLGVGISQVPFKTNVRPTLKSEGPRFNRISNHERLEIELLNESPAPLAELVSILFAQVKIPCTWKP